MDDPWFIRRRTPFSYTINPCCWQGWAATVIYVAAVLLITPLANSGLWLAYCALLFVQTAAFCLLLLRKSKPSSVISKGDKTVRNNLVDHYRVEKGYWFVPHMFGFGFTPVTWQGWATTIGFASLLVADVRFVPERIAQIGIGVALFALFLMIGIRKTQGGLGWHWGVRK